MYVCRASENVHTSIFSGKIPNRIIRMLEVWRGFRGYLLIDIARKVV